MNVNASSDNHMVANPRDKPLPRNTRKYQFNVYSSSSSSSSSFQNDGVFTSFASFSSNSTAPRVKAFIDRSITGHSIFQRLTKIAILQLEMRRAPVMLGDST